MSTEKLDYHLTRKEGEKIPLLIDCDPGIDDAIALMVARASCERQVLSRRGPRKRWTGWRFQSFWGVMD